MSDSEGISSELGLNEESPTKVAKDDGSVERECVFFDLDKGEFPETWPQDTDVAVVIVNLTGPEEVEVARAAQGNQSVFLIEAAKRSLAMWGGKLLNRQKAEDEIVWEKMGSRCRNLIAGRFAQLWSGSAEGTKKAKDTFRRGKLRI